MTNTSWFFKYKIAALLHDPINKAWLIAKHIDHEKKALEYGTGILKNTNIVNEIKSLMKSYVVRYADSLASSTDRWVISILTTYRDSEGRVRYIEGAFGVREANKLRNVIDPRFYVELEEPSENSIREFIESLSKHVAIAKDNVRLIYHLLYALYEPMFYSIVGEGSDTFVGSVADTRAPTHTVFDHVYATASIVNILSSLTEEMLIGKSVKEVLDGYIAVIDLAGIQKFISASRKLRDLWFSSWIASTMAWATIWPLIYALGPDIMVSPSPRNNPFYYSSLLAVLKLKTKNLEDIEKYFTKAIGFKNKDIPKFGVMPTQIILLLPKLDIVMQCLSEVIEENILPENIKNVIKKNINEIKEDPAQVTKLIIDIYRSLWSTIVSEVEDQLLNSSNDILKALRIFLIKYNYWSEEGIKKVFNAIKDYPLLPIRVVVLRIKDILMKEGREIEEYEVYDKLINNAVNELRNISLLKYTYPPLPPIEQIYEYVTGLAKISKRGYEYCSICGLMPAILKMPSAEEWDKISKGEFTDWAKELDRENVKPYVIEPFFSPGERLCVYDLIKRLLTIDDILNEVVKKILCKEIGKIRLESFPSTSHIATVEFYKKLAEAYMKAHSKHIDTELDNKVAEVISELIAYKPFRPIVRFTPYRHLEKVKDDVKEKFKERYEQLSFEIFVSFLDPDTYVLSSEARKKLRELNKFIKEKIGLELPIKTYYSIIRADADNMGKLLRGDTSIALNLDPMDYLLEALEGGARNIVKLVSDNKINEAVNELVKEYSNKVFNPEKIAKDNISRLHKLLGILKNRILLTPTYHAIISRSLMITALIDQYIIEEEEKGFIVYSGGDDLLALSPVETSISLTYKTRKVFSMGHYIVEKLDNKGFMSKDLLSKVGLATYIVPLIPTGGRSYSITYLHYRYPLYTGLAISYEHLEEKENIRWIINSVKFAKDMVNIAYIPRGYKVLSTILPFKQKECIAKGKNVNMFIKNYDVSALIKELVSVWKELDKGKVSKSLVYDLIKEKNVINKILEKYEKNLYDKFIEYIITRNVGNKKEVGELEVTKLFKKYIDYKIVNVKIGKEIPIILNLVDFLKIYYSALRGVI